MVKFLRKSNKFTRLNIQDLAKLKVKYKVGNNVSLDYFSQLMSLKFMKNVKNLRLNFWNT